MFFNFVFFSNIVTIYYENDKILLTPNRRNSLSIYISTYFLVQIRFGWSIEVQNICIHGRRWSRPNFPPHLNRYRYNSSFSFLPVYCCQEAVT